DNGEVGSGGGADVVLEGHDPGDGVDALRLPAGELLVEGLDDDRPLGARGGRGLNRGAIGDQPAIALDVDDYRVELGARHQVEHPLAGTAIGHTAVGGVGG